VPDDLLRHVIGPTPYSSSWLWIAILLLVVLILWYATVFLSTLPERRLRDLPMIGVARDKLLKRRFASAVREAGERYRSGDLAAAPAGAAVSGALRGFLQQATGIRVQYMQVEDIATSDVAVAAPLLQQLNDAQFNAATQVDVGQVSDHAEELIRSWT
jgi:hypothetical protein